HATLPVGARAKAKRIELVLAEAGPTAIAIRQGELHLWKGLALTGIEGTVLPQLALTGGYGGVQQTLWRAAGEIDYARGEAGASGDCRSSRRSCSIRASRSR